jgi:hypothetical protein
MFKNLDIDKVTAAIELLRLRVQERFPTANLLNVCNELKELSNNAKANIQQLNKPYIYFRILFSFLIIITIVVLSYTIWHISRQDLPSNFQSFIATSEALMNELVMIAAAFYFIGKFENSLKQKKILYALQELRTIIHIIDLHQLTKDPAPILQNNTEHSPERALSKSELNRYLDYCSEMLSLTSKVAATYSFNSNDQVVLDTIHNIEVLSGTLSNKIWQKITINI